MPSSPKNKLGLGDVLGRDIGIGCNGWLSGSNGRQGGTRARVANGAEAGSRQSGQGGVGEIVGGRFDH